MDTIEALQDCGFSTDVAGIINKMKEEIENWEDTKRNWKHVSQQVQEIAGLFLYSNRLFCLINN